MRDKQQPDEQESGDESLSRISRRFTVNTSSDVIVARRAWRSPIADLGFNENAQAEIQLVITELGTNLVKHAGGGEILIEGVSDGERRGLRIETRDEGPGIACPDEALSDGFSTSGGLGYGLGTVCRLASEFHISPPSMDKRGAHLVAIRWLDPDPKLQKRPPLDIGVATRHHPGMKVNGDGYVFENWNGSTLAGVIDGLGHGHFAHKATVTAITHIRQCYRDDLPTLFRGVARACRPTRGVVMTLARFDSESAGLTLSGIGNVEARLIREDVSTSFVSRRGILGVRSPNPSSENYVWRADYILVIHSDGLSASWRPRDFGSLWDGSAQLIARDLLKAKSRDHDDATVMVIKGSK